MTVATLSLCGPVGMLVGKSGVVRDVFHERLKRRHLDVIGRGGIVGPVPAVLNACADVSEEYVGLFNPLKLGSVRFSFRSVAINLCGIEHGIAASEQQAGA